MSIQDKLRQDFGFGNFVEACQRAKDLQKELDSLKTEIAEKDLVLEKYKNIAWQTGGNMTREESMAAATVLQKYKKG